MSTGYVTVRNRPTFRTKSGHDRTIYVTGDARAVLERLDARRVSEADDNIFLSVSGIRLNETYVSKRLKTSLEQPTRTSIELSAYPSPFTDGLTVSFTLPDVSDVRVTLFDVLGRPVDQISAGVMTGGRHEFGFNANGLPNGIYLIRMVTEGTETTRTVIKVD